MSPVFPASIYGEIQTQNTLFSIYKNYLDNSNDIWYDNFHIHKEVIHMEQLQEEKLTIKEYVYRVAAGVSNAVLVMLGIGLLFETIGNFIHWPAFHSIGTVAKLLLAPAFGAGIAYQLKGNTLVIFSSMVASTIGANAVYFTSDAMQAMTATGHTLLQPASSGIFVTGQPISAVLAGLIAALVGKWITGKTFLDMVFIPFSSILVGGIAGLGLAAVTTPLLLQVSAFMAKSVTVSPILGSVVVSLVWSVLLMTPASSAALAIALQLDPVSSAAALIGCTAQFVGFTIMSWRENNLGANISQGLITPKVQFPNLTLHPQLVIPPFIAAAICAPIATVGFGFRSTYELAGLGLNSLIAPLNILSTSTSEFLVYMGVGVVLSGVITFVVHVVFRRMRWTMKDDLRIEVQ